MNPDQPHSAPGSLPEPPKHSIVDGRDPDSERKIRVPLSANEIATGSAIFHLDSFELPSRIELFQRQERNSRKVFDIHIPEQFRALFAQQSLFADQEQSISCIHKTMQSCQATAHTTSLVLPQIIRQSEEAITIENAIGSSTETIIARACHAPLSIEEWSFGHQRHHTSLERRDSDGALLAELVINSLRYPDRSMRHDITIISHREQEILLPPYIATLCHRGHDAHDTRSDIAQTLYDNFVAMPLDEFLTCYFGEDSRTSQNNGDIQLHSNERNTTRGLSWHLSPQRTKPKEVLESGIQTLANDITIEWNFADWKRQLVIYPYLDDQSVSVSFTPFSWHGDKRIPGYGDMQQFLLIVEKLCSGNIDIANSALSLLCLPTHFRANGLGAPMTRNIEVLLSDIGNSTQANETLPTKRLSYANYSNIDPERTLIDLFQGYEWVGFQNRCQAAPIPADLVEIPNKIFFKLWQGGCQEIILAGSVGPKISILPQTNALFEGSIPEMREHLRNAFALFEQNPFALIQQYFNNNASITTVFDRPASATLIKRLRFFAELLTCDVLNGNKIFGKAKGETYFLRNCASVDKLTILSNYTKASTFVLHFNECRLNSLLLIERPSLWQRVINLNFLAPRHTIVIPDEITLTPKQVVALCHSIQEALEKRVAERKNKDTNGVYLRAIDSAIEAFRQST